MQVTIEAGIKGIIQGYLAPFEPVEETIRGCLRDGVIDPSWRYAQAQFIV